MTRLHRKLLTCCFLSALGSLALAGRIPFLEVYGAGMLVGDVAPVLYDGDTFCVSSLPFTLFCKGMEGAESVVWNYRGRDIAKDDGPPFSIAGERNGLPRPWKGFQGPGMLICTSSDGSSVQVQLEAPCAVSVSPGARTKTSTLPKESPNPSVASAIASESQLDNFVVFNASTYLNLERQLPDGWKAVNTSLVYRQGSGSWIAPAPQTDSGFLSYAFLAPGNFTYALAMDSTPGPTNATVLSLTDHNDVYVRLRKPGFTRRRLKIVGENLQDVTKKPTAAWLKVYQNQATRSWQAATTDHLPDYLSTSKPLVSGSEYILEVAGRSTDFSLHGFCLFPCSGRRCSRQTVFWQEQEKLCSLLRDA